jgi:hypothetical protein
MVSTTGLQAFIWLQVPLILELVRLKEGLVGIRRCKVNGVLFRFFLSHVPQPWYNLRVLRIPMPFFVTLPRYVMETNNFKNFKLMLCILTRYVFMTHAQIILTWWAGFDKISLSSLCVWYIMFDRRSSPKENLLHDFLCRQRNQHIFTTIIP